MDDLTQQQTQAQFLSLPRVLRDTLSAPETYEKVALVAKKYGLTRVETGLLAQATGTLMLGFLKPNEFVATVIDYLAIPRDEAMLIAQDLNRDLFNDVKDSLKQLYAVGTNAPSRTPRGLVLSPAQGTVNMANTSPPPQTQSTKPPNTPAPQVSRQAVVQPARPTNAPVRSDWSWHGSKNDITGDIEFRHESTQKIPTSPSTARGTGEHTESIFEQKLGGAFRIKGEAVEYRGAPAQAITTPSPLVASKPALHVPHKPVEVKIPPVQAQPPK